MSSPQFAITLMSFHNEQSLHEVLRFLATVFKDQTRSEIESILRQAPVLIASELTRPAMDLLRKHLSARGAEVLIERQAVDLKSVVFTELETTLPMVSAAAPTRSVGVIEPSNCAPQEVAPPEMIYTFRRPGWREAVF